MPVLMKQWHQKEPSFNLERLYHLLKRKMSECLIYNLRVLLTNYPHTTRPFFPVIFGYSLIICGLATPD